MFFRGHSGTFLLMTRNFLLDCRVALYNPHLLPDTLLVSQTKFAKVQCEAQGEAGILNFLLPLTDSWQEEKVLTKGFAFCLFFVLVLKA